MVQNLNDEAMAEANKPNNDNESGNTNAEQQTEQNNQNNDRIMVGELGAKPRY